jgi:ribosomal protein L11 methylase PrmA
MKEAGQLTNMEKYQSYTKEYFQSIKDTSVSSATVLIPIITQFIKPQSVVDVGSGTGIWLKAWEKEGVNDYIGLDGDYISQDQLVIPPEKLILTQEI